MTQDQENFLRRVSGPAIQCEQENPIPPACITVSQAILETGWGKASIGNNLWGVKYNHADPQLAAWGFTENETHEILTLAELNDLRARGAKILAIVNRQDGMFDVTIMDKFQAFPTVLAAVQSRVKLFQEPQYLRARAALSVSGWQGFAEALGPQIDPNTGKPVVGQPPTYSTYVPEKPGDPTYGDILAKLVTDFQLDDPVVLQSYALPTEMGGAS